MNIAIYARVSTNNGQDPEMQLRELREYCQRRDWEIIHEYVDVGISGTREKRPQLDRLLADAHRRYFDVVVVWRFDRFARSVSHLLRALENFRSLRIEFVSLSEQVDTSTPTGKMIFTVLGAVAELECSLMQQEEVRLLESCGRVRSRFLKPLVILVLNTGMRRGELLSLDWSQVDLANLRIRIVNAKSSSGERSIPMNTTAFGVLTELAGNRASRLVFPSNRREGERILDLKKGFKKAVMLAVIPKIRFHDLRHTFATRLVRLGADLITVQQLLGRAKITMTARYAHSMADDKIAAVSKLDFAGSCSSPDPNRTPGPQMPVSETGAKVLQSSTIGP